MALSKLASRYGWLAAASIAGAASTPMIAWADDKSKAYFDPEALERGAKALREINASPLSKQVMELSKQQELTKQTEAKEREADYKRQAAALAKDQERVRWEEQRKFQQEEAQRQAQLAQYNDELARKRLQQQHEMDRQKNAELVQMQEDSYARKESERLRIEQQIQAERRAAEQYASDLQKQVQRERALAEADGRIKEARENEDIHRREQQLRLQEEREKAVQVINTVFTNLGAGAVELLMDRDKLLMVVLGLSGVFVGLYSAREGTRVAGRVLEAWLGTPSLVRETSRIRFWQSKFWANKLKSVEEVKRDFSDIVFKGDLHDQVRSLAATASNTRSHGAPFRHMLFYGPPGTGKTMAAKRLARTSGLDYAIMSGGDVAPLGGLAVTQLHRTFDWAERSRRGLLLFIDEADAFLGRRGEHMSEGMRGSLNALLYRTGDQSRDFMVVLATNRPGDLDEAVLDRMDEALEFGLPGFDERLHMLELYMDKYISKTGTTEAGAGAGGRLSFGERIRGLIRGQKALADKIEIGAGVDEKLLRDAASKMDGFSGREIAKFVASVQAAVYGTQLAVLTPEIFNRALDHKLHQHRERILFRQGLHGEHSDTPTTSGRLPASTTS